MLEEGWKAWNGWLFGRDRTNETYIRVGLNIISSRNYSPVKTLPSVATVCLRLYSMTCGWIEILHL